MGIGDELMAAGEAQRRAAGTARRFLLIDKFGVAAWHNVWEGHPHIAQPGKPYDEPLECFVNGKRPYIAEIKPEQYTFRAYTPMPALLTLGRQAQAFAARTAGAIVFNPMVKRRASQNKAWGYERWRELVRLVRGVRWVQLLEPGAPSIRGAEPMIAQSFLDACGALKGARLAVLQEGGLHHAAAAVGTPAIVIRGGFISPRVTGYAGQFDFYVADARYPFGCGMRTQCLHCADAMASITPAAVARKMKELLA